MPIAKLSHYPRVPSYCKGLPYCDQRPIVKLRSQTNCLTCPCLLQGIALLPIDKLRSQTNCPLPYCLACPCILQRIALLPNLSLLTARDCPLPNCPLPNCLIALLPYCGRRPIALLVNGGIEFIKLKVESS